MRSVSFFAILLWKPRYGAEDERNSVKERNPAIDAAILCK
jgi:hypothetical protein